MDKKIETIIKSLDKEGIDYTYHDEDNTITIYAVGGWEDYDLSNKREVNEWYKQALDILKRG